MHLASTNRYRSLLSGHSIVRLLIVSYFVALALGVIQGTDLASLAKPFLPDWFAGVLTSGLVLALSVMILTGWQRRPAALVLALMMFWASYMAMMRAPDQELGAFWRDLALIGALVMTYADGQRRPAAHRKASDQPDDDRPRSRISQAIASTRSVVSRPNTRTASANQREQAELFRKDLDIVRAS